MILDDESSELPTRAELGELAELQLRRRWLWGWLFGAVLLACAAAAISARLLSVVMPVWMVVWGALILRHAWYRCPRCGQFFNWGGRGSNPFTRACIHCGLRLPAEDGEGSAR